MSARKKLLIVSASAMIACFVAPNAQGHQAESFYMHQVYSSSLTGAASQHVAFIAPVDANGRVIGTFVESQPDLIEPCQNSMSNLDKLMTVVMDSMQ